MKKLILLLVALVMLTSSLAVAAPIMADAYYQLPLEQIALGDRWHFCADDGAGNPPANYTEAASTFSLGYATVVGDATPIESDGCGTGTGDYDLHTYNNGGADAGWELQLCSQADTDITLSTTGDADFICVVTVTGSVFHGCIDITAAPETISDTGGTASYDGTGAFQMRYIQ